MVSHTGISLFLFRSICFLIVLCLWSIYFVNLFLFLSPGAIALSFFHQVGWRGFIVVPSTLHFCIQSVEITNYSLSGCTTKKHLQKIFLCSIPWPSRELGHLLTKIFLRINIIIQSQMLATESLFPPLPCIRFCWDPLPNKTLMGRKRKVEVLQQGQFYWTEN